MENENNIDLLAVSNTDLKRTKVSLQQGIQSNQLSQENWMRIISSLDLSAAFDLVDLDLLLTRLKIMGIPNDILSLLNIWLRNRYFYVQATNDNSRIYDIDIGTAQVQGSILGPIL